MSTSRDYRKRTQRKNLITTIIAGAVIVAAVVAIVLVVMALIKNHSSDNPSPSADASSATEQPTLYLPSEQGGLTPSQVPTQQQGSSPAQPTVPASSEATAAPTAPPSTKAPEDKPIDPGAVETPTESVSPDNSGTGCIRTEAPLDVYTDDSGVLHVFTPAGYNWTYQSDGEHVTITCRAHDNQYEFLVTGVVPGSTDFAPQYFVNADKSAWVKVPVSAYVDSNLRVTVAG